MNAMLSSEGAGLPPSNPGDPNLNAAKLRKRTKTGCLTCRKRRIKCGEERPTCANCFKSKRVCEGYSQRVVFKPPIGDWPGPQNGAGMSYPEAYIQGGLEDFNTRPIPPPILTHDPSGAGLPSRGDYSFDSQGSSAAFGGVHGLGQLSSPTTIGLHSAPPYMQSHSIPPSPYNLVSPSHNTAEFSQYPLSAVFQSPTDLPFHSPPLQSPSYHPNIASSQHYGLSPNFPQAWQPHAPEVFPPTPASLTQGSDPFTATHGPPTPAFAAHIGPQQHIAQQHQTPMQHWQAGQSQQKLPQKHDPMGHFAVAPALRKDSVGSTRTASQPHPTAQVWPDPYAGPFSTELPNSTQLLDEAAVENEDDDYFDVHSDEELEAGLDETALSAKLGMILQISRQSTSEMTMRRYDNFIYAGILDAYRAERVASPLRNPKTARVFAHFIFATGPTLSIFERKARNASALFDDSPSLDSQRSLWTYILPSMALQRQALLHAILALSSLHIAKLQGASVTPSFKHYAYSLKRLRNLLLNPAKRHLPTTLAATLMLGFYEVMTADHLKWSSHLQGAKQLILELDYVSMAAEAKKLKARLRYREDQFAYGHLDTSMQSQNRAYDDVTIINEQFVSNMVGYAVDYDRHGLMDDERGDRRPSSTNLRDLDLSKWELYQDLFWWYLKQDVYQAVVSGNHLILEYNRWADCPPRADMNRPDAIYGSFDHFVLVLGRIADFNARDRTRKLQVMDTNGGQWRPHPSLKMPRPPNPPQGRPSAQPPQNSQPSQMPGQSTNPPPQGPPFFGMAPMPPHRPMPSSFTNPFGEASTPPPTTNLGQTDLKSATDSALNEWANIKAALEALANNLGPAFQPLSPESAPLPPSAGDNNDMEQSPFSGKTLQYRSYDIAVLWGFIYMARIILVRSHPYMPPAALSAATIAAQSTNGLAQVIGQIAIGITPSPPSQPLNPSVGATLCEMALPLFFAGVQYREDDQRHWLVNRVRDIEFRTGWASVGMIAHGCERAWGRLGEMGLAPPYVPHRPHHIGALSSDDRVRQRFPPIGPGAMAEGTGIIGEIDRSVSTVIKGEGGGEAKETRFLLRGASTSLPYAFGLLGTDAEEDLTRKTKRMEI